MHLTRSCRWWEEQVLFYSDKLTDQRIIVLAARCILLQGTALALAADMEAETEMGKRLRPVRRRAAAGRVLLQAPLHREECENPKNDFNRADHRQLSSHCLQRRQAQQRHGNAQRHPDHPRVPLGPRSRVSVSGVEFLSSEPARDGTFYGFAVSQTSHLVLWRLRLALAVKQTVAAPRLLPEDDTLRRRVKRRARALKWEIAAVEDFDAPVGPLPCLREIYAEPLLQFVALAKAIDLSRRVEPPFLAVLAGVDTHSAMKLRLLDFKAHF